MAAKRRNWKRLTKIVGLNVLALSGILMLPSLTFPIVLAISAISLLILASRKASRVCEVIRELPWVNRTLPAIFGFAEAVSHWVLLFSVTAALFFYVEGSSNAWSALGFAAVSATLKTVVSRAHYRLFARLRLSKLKG